MQERGVSTPAGTPARIIMEQQTAKKLPRDLRAQTDYATLPRGYRSGQECPRSFRPSAPFK